MTEAEEIKKAVQQLSGTFNKDFVELIVCTVDSVDEDTMSCDCTPISGNATTSIPGVKLNADTNDGFLILPTVGSTVIVSTSTRNNYFVFMYSDIDKIVCVIDNNNSYEFSSSGFIWNNGTFGGMAKTPVLKTKYNTLEAQHNAIKVIVSAIIAAGVSSPGTPVTNATLAAYFSGFNVTSVTPTTQLEIEDNKIKH